MFKVSCIQLCSSDCDRNNLKRTTALIKKAIILFVKLLKAFKLADIMINCFELKY